MFKSEWVTNAKRLLQSPLGFKIDTIVTEEHLEFAKHLHEIIVKLELKPAFKKKGETQSRIAPPKTSRVYNYVVK